MAALWPMSLIWRLYYVHAEENWCFSVTKGAVVVSWDRGWFGPTGWRLREPDGFHDLAASNGFALPRIGNKTLFYGSEVYVPLWFPLLIMAIPTYALFRRDRRIPSGHCPTCGYNLTGNTSGKCSECGARIARPE